jgi:PAS domain S-box-containing protein
LIVGTSNFLPVLISSSSGNNSGSQSISVVVTDLTEQKRNEDIIASERLYLQEQLNITNSLLNELAFQNEEKEKRAAELVIANKELAFQNEEKAKRAAELVIAKKELVFQNEIKQRAAELVIANKELVFQKDSLRKLARAVEQAPVSIIITDKNQTIEFVNPIYLQISGYTAEEVIGKKPCIIKSGETPQETYRELWLALESGETWEGEFINKRKNGSIFHEHAIISALHDDNGTITHYLGVKEDITERKQMEDVIAVKRTQLEALNNSLQEKIDGAIKELRLKDQMMIAQSRQAAMGEMIGNIAHQWRQPLNALSMVLGNIQFADKYNELTTEFITEAVDKGGQLIQKMSATITDFSNFRTTDLLARV